MTTTLVFIVALVVLLVCIVAGEAWFNDAGRK
jgi:hypothetical protein